MADFLTKIYRDRVHLPGVPTTSTAPLHTSSKQIATTEFVQNELSEFLAYNETSFDKSMWVLESTNNGTQYTLQRTTSNSLFEHIYIRDENTGKYRRIDDVVTIERVNPDSNNAYWKIYTNNEPFSGRFRTMGKYFPITLSYKITSNTDSRKECRVTGIERNPNNETVVNIPSSKVLSYYEKTKDTTIQGGKTYYKLSGGGYVKVNTASLIGQSATSYYEQYSDTFTVTSIAERAFYGRSELVEFNLPPTLTSIYSQAFAQTSIREFTPAYGLETLGSYVFENCSNLKRAILPDSVDNIGTFLFSRCHNLTEVKLPDNNGFNDFSKTNGMFYYCSNLHDVTLPLSWKYFKGQTMFYACGNAGENYLNLTALGLECADPDDVFIYANSSVNLRLGPDYGKQGAGCPAYWIKHLKVTFSETPKYCTIKNGVIFHNATGKVIFIQDNDPDPDSPTSFDNEFLIIPKEAEYFYQSIYYSGSLYYIGFEPRRTMVATTHTSFQSGITYFERYVPSHLTVFRKNTDYYELVNGKYVKTSDTVRNASKKYYRYLGDGNYFPTLDKTFVSGKTYYTETDTVTYNGNPIKVSYRSFMCNYSFIYFSRDVYFAHFGKVIEVSNQCLVDAKSTYAYSKNYSVYSFMRKADNIGDACWNGRNDLPLVSAPSDAYETDDWGRQIKYFSVLIHFYNEAPTSLTPVKISNNVRVIIGGLGGLRIQIGKYTVTKDVSIKVSIDAREIKVDPQNACLYSYKGCLYSRTFSSWNNMLSGKDRTELNENKFYGDVLKRLPWYNISKQVYSQMIPYMSNVLDANGNFFVDVPLGPIQYVDSIDTTYDSSKVYYKIRRVFSPVTSFPEGTFVFEKSGSNYVITHDTTPVAGKTYYSCEEIFDKIEGRSGTIPPTENLFEVPSKSTRIINGCSYKNISYTLTPYSILNDVDAEYWNYIIFNGGALPLDNQRFTNGGFMHINGLCTTTYNDVSYVSDRNPNCTMSFGPKARISTINYSNSPSSAITLKKSNYHTLDLSNCRPIEIYTSIYLAGFGYETLILPPRVQIDFISRFPFLKKLILTSPPGYIPYFFESYYMTQGDPSSGGRVYELDLESNSYVETTDTTAIPDKRYFQRSVFSVSIGVQRPLYFSLKSVAPTNLEGNLESVEFYDHVCKRTNDTYYADGKRYYTLTSNGYVLKNVTAGTSITNPESTYEIDIESGAATWFEKYQNTLNCTPIRKVFDFSGYTYVP